MHRLIPASFPLLLAIASPVHAGEVDGFRLSGSARLRFETIDDQARAGFNTADSLVNLRTQVMAEYRARPFRVVLDLYDSRVWGGDAGTPVTTGEVNALELVQAYVAADLGPVLGKGTRTGIQAGRMMLNLGSRRLVAADDYRNTTNGYTGVKLDLATDAGTTATLIYTLPQVRLPDDAAGLRARRVEWDRETFDLVLWGGLVGHPLARRTGAPPVRGELAFFHLGERDAPGRPSRDRSLDTAEARIVAEPKPGHVDYELEAMYQWGMASASLAAAAPRQQVSATYFRMAAGYTLPDAWKTRILFELDRASGDGAGPTYGRFDPLFGMRRGDLAPSGLYNAIARANVVSPGMRVEVAPPGRLDAFIGYRALWLASRTDAFSSTGVRDAAGRSGSFAGHQFDVRLRYWLIPAHLRFELDGVLLAKGRFLREAPNAPPGPSTRYLSLNLTASL